MIKKSTFLLFVFISTALSAQHKETRMINAFDGIKAVSGGNIVYHVSDESKVTIESSERSNLRYIETKITNKTLEIKIQKAEKKIDLKNLHIHIYGKTLEKIDIGSATVFKVQDHLQLPSFRIEQKGFSEVDLGPGFQVKDLLLNVQSYSVLKGILDAETISGSIKAFSIWKSSVKANDIRVQVQKSSSIFLEGTAHTIYLNTTGSSIANTLKLTAGKAELISEGSSVVESWVTNSLHAKAEKTAQIMIKGTPSLTYIYTKNMGLIANKNGKTYSNSF